MSNLYATCTVHRDAFGEDEFRINNENVFDDGYFGT